MRFDLFVHAAEDEFISNLPIPSFPVRRRRGSTRVRVPKTEHWIIDICTYIRHYIGMNWSVAGFDWDEGNEEKCLKHGVSIREIEELFESTVTILPDDAHSTDAEERRLVVGRTKRGRHVLVAFTLRERGGETLVRPISARCMHREEIVHYEKENPGLEDG